MQVSDSTKQEILALEKRYWDAIRQNDPNVTAMLSDDPCVVVGAHGVGELHRAAMAEMMKKATGSSSSTSSTTCTCARSTTMSSPWPTRSTRT